MCYDIVAVLRHAMLYAKFALWFTFSLCHLKMMTGHAVLRFAVL